MFGLYPKFKPRMAKVFGNASEVILKGLTQYVMRLPATLFREKELLHNADVEYKKLLTMI